MYGREKQLKDVFTRIAAVLLFLILFFNIYSIACVVREGLIALFPRVVWLDCVTDIFCSLLYFLSFLLPALIFYGISPKSESIAVDFSIRLPSPNTFFKTIAVIFVSLGTIIAISYLNAWLVPSFSSVGVLEQTTKPYQLVLLMFSSAVIPAFAEELLFRGVILTNLKPYGRGVAVVASAFLFGIMHMNLSQLLYATAAGIVFGVIYVTTNSLWLCILIHFANNLFNILENYMFQIFSSQQAELICMLAELLIFALGISFALIYILSKKNAKKAERKIGVFGKTETVEMNSPLEGHQELRAFFCPVMIIYIAVVALNMLYVLGVQYLVS